MGKPFDMNEPSDKREPSEAEQKLERLIDRTLRGLPLRPAPTSLETRVLGELERRAALPWWRRSFAQWPQSARAAFVLMCGALVALAFPGGDWAAAGLRSLHVSGALSMPWAQQATALAGAASELGASLARAVPAHWVYGGLAVSAALYAALFGLGAAAYRTLYLDSDLAGDRG